MPKLYLSIMMTLDGYAAGPDGELDWIMVDDPEMAELMAEQLRGIDAMIFGHTAYRDLAEYWMDGPTEKPVDREHTRLMNSITKLVLSRGEPELHWTPAQRIGADLAAEIGELKAKSGKDIAVFAGAETARELASFVDEYRLLVYPVLLGAGRPVFRPAPEALEFLGSREFSASGVVQLRYRPVR
ncbi:MULTISPECIES: dihydrofolate reductase family protein [unclassified Crossiella]|uniref:dihydrofolate reductase family protein n=1 Tax=unclassified Crossiella TaxID=2620835 RepID=UPI001FFF38C7|nr:MULTISPECIES: dihydrofolate reductase family protein [unclassified Crossiella]MCK2244680.1 dihydrofolate reductase family protein [Crossiella sp. S99.2]MCK2258333.1 dihydrofolate reductase family protein [Crossiella sp. S99.1]